MNYIVNIRFTATEFTTTDFGVPEYARILVLDATSPEDAAQKAETLLHAWYDIRTIEASASHPVPVVEKVTFLWSTIYICQGLT